MRQNAHSPLPLRHQRALHAHAVLARADEAPPTSPPSPESAVTASASDSNSTPSPDGFDSPSPSPSPSPSSSSGPTSSGTGPTSGPACFTTTTLTTTTCPLQSSGFGTCTTTVLSSSACAPGLYCTTHTASSNNNTATTICMRRQDAPDLIITVVFAAITFLGLVGLIFSCCRDSFRRRARSGQQIAVDDAKMTSGSGSKAAHRPLMPREEDDEDDLGANPFLDDHHVNPEPYHHLQGK